MTSQPETIPSCYGDRATEFQPHSGRHPVARTQLAGEVLPSLEDFHLAIDVRVRVVDGEVKTSIPVVVIHIGTDVSEDFWFQMTRGDVEETIRKLSKCLEDMKLAETLVLRKN